MCGKYPCDSQDCTWSDQYRRECEARWVLSLSDAEMKRYGAMVKKARGIPAAKALNEEVKRQWGTQ